jgi:hypothetical protein
MAYRKLVVLYINPDPSSLGEGATKADLDRWAENLADDIESRFEVLVQVNTGARGGRDYCSDKVIDQWLVGVLTSDMW